jgi:hypothetical protein
MSQRKQTPIPLDVREQADQIVADFNTRVIRNPACFYVARYTGPYLYLHRHNHGAVGPICRLNYQGALNNWGFAIYKYSRERYDPDEMFFPGSEFVDGTIDGAMNAGLEAYPLSDYNNTSLLGRMLSLLFGSLR